MVQAARCRRVVDPGDCPYLLFDRRSNPVERRAQLVVDTHAEPAQRAPDHAGTPSGVESTTWLSLEEAMHLEFRVSVRTLKPPFWVPSRVAGTVVCRGSAPSR